MLAVPVPLSFPVLAAAAQPEALPTLPIVVALALAIAVLVSIALDLRRLRRSSKLRAVHSAVGAVFTVVVVAGTLALTSALGSAPSATADQPETPIVDIFEPVPIPESIDTSDITDPSTDIQLPTLAD